MIQVRVLAAAAPEMLQDIILQVLAGEPDFAVRIVPAAEDEEPEPPDVIILTVAGDRPVDDWPRPVGVRARTKVLALEADGRRAFLYELCPRKVPLGELSPQRLIAAIRDAAVAGVSRAAE